MTYLPGSYEVEVWVNDSPLLSRTVTFKADDENQLIPGIGIRAESLVIEFLICVSVFLMALHAGAGRADLNSFFRGR
ncbi:hypothetical protein [Escherichia coli]|uniref:hypothetical protein n=1 Tax=Escherichia coli TaxID=562 RepID=UPI003B431D5F